MSTRQTGNRSENEVAEMAEALGYAVWKSRGSRGEADLICFEDHHGFKWWDGFKTPIVIQVGTSGKAIAATLNDLEASARPIGSLCVVSRRHSVKKPGKARTVKWTHHSRAGKFETLAALLDAR